MSKSEINTSAVLVGCSLVGVFLLAVFLPILTYSVAFMYIWNLYMPLIFELPVVTIAQSAGIVILASLLTAETSKTKDNRDDNDKIMSAVGHVILTPAFLMFLAWVCSLFL